MKHRTLRLRARMWIVSWITVLSLVIPVTGATPTLAHTEAGGETPDRSARSHQTALERLNLQAVTAENLIPAASAAGDYVVLFNEPPLASYRGSIPGLASTNPQALGQDVLDIESAASRAYLTHLKRRHAHFVASATQALDREIVPFYTYYYALNGLAVTLSEGEASKLAALDNVAQVLPDEARALTTDAGPAWIGAPDVWDGTATGTTTLGEGVVVGILDTGINTDHPSFSDPGPIDGYDYTWSGSYLGICVTEPAFVCNDKLIGMYSFVRERGESSSPEDGNGHGTHTASTAAGNVVTATLFPAYTHTLPLAELQISGVAPHAHIIAYDVCLDPGNGSCYLTDSVAAVEQAILDGVDVINFSIGGGTNPYTDLVSLAFLAAADAGIVVSKAAGNEGPDESTVAGRSPWVLTVGAGTHNRALTFSSALTDFSGGIIPPDRLEGRSITGAYGPAPVVFAGDVGDSLCGTAFPAGTWTQGEIVVCNRGTYALVEKASNVKGGGAGGVIIANTLADGRTTLFDIAYDLPAVHINITETTTLMTWLGTGTGHMAAIEAATATRTLDPTLGDIMADFSSRGPNTTFDVLKPDVIAPGVAVLAAVSTTDAAAPPEYGLYQGTSMAAPHAAGAAALLKALYPGWSPMEIKSALMMTAQSQSIRDYTGLSTTDPNVTGSGRLRVQAAAAVGFVLDETRDHFEAANPAIGGDARILNLASMQNSACFGACTWTRTLSSTLETPITWHTAASNPAFSVTPVTFTLPSGGTQVITVTAQVNGLPRGDWIFATATFTTTDLAGPGGRSVADAQMPIAVLPTDGLFPESTTVRTRRDAGSGPVSGIQTYADPLTTTVRGKIATITTFSLAEDPTNQWGPGGDPGGMYDDLTQVHVITFTVPGNALYVALEHLETTSPDLDMTFGYDTNGDGKPSAAEEIAYSGSQGALESIFLDAKDLKEAVGPIVYASGGTYWAVVMNWEASVTGATDTVKMAMATVSATDVDPQVTVDAPAAASGITPLDATLIYDFTTAWDVWYGIVTLFDGSTLLRSIPARIYRYPDDVIKQVQAWAANGAMMTITYEIIIAPNITGRDITYILTDTVPSGMTLVPGSATGGAIITGNQVRWTGVMPGAARFRISDSKTDAACSIYGGYVDWQTEEGYATLPGIEGDTSAWTTFEEITFDFFGNTYKGITFVDDGFAIFDASSYYGAAPWLNQNLPDPVLPNNLIAGLWKDLEIIYSAADNYGVTLVTDNNTVGIIEYDDVRPRGTDGSQHYDVEFWIWAKPGMGPEITIEYDNITGPVSDAVVGVENSTGTQGLVHPMPSVIMDGLTICFDWTTPAESQTITYQAMAPRSGSYLNIVQHSTDDPYARPVMTTHLQRWLSAYLPLILRGAGAP